MLAFEIAALGLLTFFTVSTSGFKCTKETLTRHVVCYYKGEVPLSNLTVCDCTHLIFTNAITKGVNNSLDISEGLKKDLSLAKDAKKDLITIFTLTLKENESSLILKSQNKTQKMIREIAAVLEEVPFDGVELDFKFSKGDGVSKDSYTFFIKNLSKSITTVQHRRVKRDELEDNDEDNSSNVTTTTTVATTENTTWETTTTTTTVLDLSETDNTTKTSEEEKEEKSENRTEDFSTAETSTENRTDENSTESNDDAKKFLLLIRLPLQMEIVGKKYDLKALTRYADLLTVPTHHIVNEKESQLTYHPSRLMGISDIFNTDSILDFLTGMGAEKSKIIISMPASVLKFQLKDEGKNAPGMPAVSGPEKLNQAELCSLLKKKNWTLERDEDLTAPYAFSGKTWIAFEDEVSVKIKGKYILLRELAGGAIYPIDDDINDKSCTNSTVEGGYLTNILFNNFKSLERKPRALVLQNLQEEIHDNAYSSIEAGVKLSEYRIVRVVDHSGAVHVIRKNTKTQFECSRQGYFSHPLGCNKFYRCVKFDQYSDEYTVFEYNCPVGLAFDERYEVCVWPGSLPNGAPCTGSSEIAPVPRAHFQCPNQEGYYADPENCRWFFACLDHARDGITPLTAYEFRCPFGLVFNAEKFACDWPWLVGGCGAQGAQGYIFGQSGGSASASNTAVFINGGNLEASLGQYGNLNQDNFLGKGYGSVLKNIGGSTFGSKIQNSYQGSSQPAATGFIASPFDDNSKRASFASFPDYEISGGRIFNKAAGVVLEENLNFPALDKNLYSESKLTNSYYNNENGNIIRSGSNSAAGFNEYDASRYSNEAVGTKFTDKNFGSIYASNGHLGQEINGLIFDSVNKNKNAAFSGSIAGQNRENSNFANGYVTGQSFGQDAIINLGTPKTEYVGIEFPSTSTTTKSLNINDNQQYGIKIQQNAHPSSNINTQTNGQFLDNQAIHFQELLPPFVEPQQPQQGFTQQPFSVNLKSVQVNEEKHLDSTGPAVITSVTPLGPSQNIFQSKAINSQAADLSQVLNNQYSTAQDITFTPTPFTNEIPITISQNKGNAASSGVSFSFSGSTPAYEINKIAKTKSDYSKGSVTASFPTPTTALPFNTQRKSSTATLSAKTIPVSTATTTPGAYSYQEFSSFSHGDYSSSIPSVPVVGFTSSDHSVGKSEQTFDQELFAPFKTSQIVSFTPIGKSDNSNFGQFKEVSLKQNGISYNVPSVTQPTSVFQSFDNSFKGLDIGLTSKELSQGNNKFSQGKVNFNVPTIVSVTPIPQFGQSDLHVAKETGTGTINEQKLNKFTFSTPKVELNLPLVTSTSTYKEFKPSGLVGGFNILPEEISTTNAQKFGQNINLNIQGNSNQLLHNVPAVTPTLEFNAIDKKSQSGSIYVGQSSSKFSGSPNSGQQFSYFPQVSSSPQPFPFETISQTPRPATFDQQKGFTPVVPKSKLVTQVSIEPQEIVSLGTITEKYDEHLFKSGSPNFDTSSSYKSTSQQYKPVISSNSSPTIPVATPTPYTNNFIKASPSPTLSAQQINNELLNINGITPSPILNLHASSFSGSTKPVFSSVTPSKAPAKQQLFVQSVTPTVSPLGKNNGFSTAVTPKIEIFRPKLQQTAFETPVESYQQTVEFLKDREISKQTNQPQSILIQNYEYTKTPPALEGGYRVDQVTQAVPIHFSSTLAPYGDTKTQSLNSFSNSFFTTTKPTFTQESIKTTSNIYGNKQFVKTNYDSGKIENKVPLTYLQNQQITQDKVAFSVPIVSINRENYSPSVEIQGGYLQSTPQTILKQQLYSTTTEGTSPIFPSVKASISLVPETQSAKIFNKDAEAHISPSKKLTESPVAFIEHTPNIPNVQQHSPRVNLLLPVTTEIPLQEYVSPVTVLSNQKLTNYENSEFLNNAGKQNLLYKSQANGLGTISGIENYDYSQETKGEKGGQSIFYSGLKYDNNFNKEVTQFSQDYNYNRNTYSKNRPELRAGTKSENQFQSYSTVGGTKSFEGNILLHPAGSLLSAGTLDKQGHDGNIQELLDKYSGDFGQVISDEKAYNGYDKGKQASSTVLYEISTEKPKQRGRGRQFYDKSSANLQATNKYEEYEIDSQKSLNDFSGSTKTDKNKNSVIVVSQVSDANPILIGKLAGQCSCQSNKLQINNKNRKTNDKRKNSNPQKNELLLENYPSGYETNQGGNIAFESVTQNEIYSPVELPPETVVIGGTKTYTPRPKSDKIKSVTVFPATNDPYLTSPSSLTSFPSTVVLSSTPNTLLSDEKLKNRRKQFRGKARYLPPTPSYDDYDSPILASDIALTQNEIGGLSSKSFAGAAYDRYGPGGWRGFDETLQGSVDCKRPGLFRHPKYCNKFYACNYDPWKERFTLHVFNCPIRLTYDSSISACNWPVGGPACADDNLLV